MNRFKSILWRSCIKPACKIVNMRMHEYVWHNPKTSNNSKPNRVTVVVYLSCENVTSQKLPMWNDNKIYEQKWYKMKWNIKKKEKYVEMSSVLIWKIVQQTFKKHSNNPKQSEKSPLLMKLVKMNEMKRTAHTVSFVLANFLLVFSKDLLLNCEYIWARRPKKKETRVKK